MAVDYTEEDIQDMKQTFLFFDKVGKGFVPTFKVGTAMRFLGHNVKENDIQNLLLEVNVTPDGKINFMAFMRMMNLMKMNDSRIGDVAGTSCTYVLIYEAQKFCDIIIKSQSLMHDV